MKVSFLILLMVSQISLSSFAQEDSKRSKTINFEDDVIEGINRKPMDSFNQISENNGRKKNHLYRKRAGFQDRDAALLTEMRLAQ